MYRKYLIIGAHPDDPDLMFGGAALQLSRAGHKVKFVSVTDGCCGHYEGKPEELAARRYEESQASARIAGVEYEILPIPDCGVEANLENRRMIVKLIREFAPDVVITHRLCDYHPDHRNAAQLVVDSSFVLRVPLYCSESPIPEKWPVFCYSWDNFQQPSTFSPSAIIAIDDVAPKKLDMLDCHKSQFYEWLPWNMGHKEFDSDNMTKEERYEWLTSNWLKRNAIQANRYRDLLSKTYGEQGNSIKYAEAFELSEYGRIPNADELKELFSV